MSLPAETQNERDGGRLVPGSTAVEPLVAAAGAAEHRWLARSPATCPIQIAVFAYTETEARQAFSASMAAWAELLTPPENPTSLPRATRPPPDGCEGAPRRTTDSARP